MIGAKASVDEIRRRFDGAVELFSNLQTGQSATVDAPLLLELVVRAAIALSPNATSVLDVGCGAGNYALKLLQLLPDLNVTLVDLSRPMLDRALQRVRAQTNGHVTAIQGDVRDVNLGIDEFDIILAGAVLHHLRTDSEWNQVFTKLNRSLKPGGTFWIVDLIEHDLPQIQEIMWQRYEEYLTGLGGEELRSIVAAEVAQQDSPRSLLFQIDLLRKTGFTSVEVLHKNSCYAAFGAIKVETATQSSGGNEVSSE
jgi:tRNA (cmo5U34)-methyltransferase